MEKVEWTSLNVKEMKALCQEKGYSSFRAKQIFEWIHKGVDFAEMMNLPLAMRNELEQSGIAQPVCIVEEHHSNVDDTVKFLFGLQDGNCIEGVLMRYHHGLTLCISTQVGCRMGCLFCASTIDGCVRNLSAGEMLGQILCVNRLLKNEQRIHNVVLMGSGEPFDNYDNVMRFLRLLREESGVTIGLRNVSLSTCGLVPEMLKFAQEGLPVTLCISLHAPNDTIRQQTMPIARRYHMKELLDACRNYIEKTGRRIIFEYALVKNVNDSLSDAQELAKKLRGMQCHVNLIPLNEVDERELKTVSNKEAQLFERTLTELGISATRRREMGDDIQGACGQLRRKAITQGEALAK